MSNPFYTVVKSENSLGLRFWIRYVLPPDWRAQEFPDVCGYADPAEAIQEFKCCNMQFRNIKDISKKSFDDHILQHDQDMRKLASWTGGNL